MPNFIFVNNLSNKITAADRRPIYMYNSYDECNLIICNTNPIIYVSVLSNLDL